MSLLMDIQTNRCWARVDFLATGEIVLYIPEECELPIRVLVSRGGRSTEYEPSNSEKPNNCEYITEDGVTCAKYPACDDCLDNPLNKVKGSKRLLKGSEQTDCQTCKWWSSYGYCVHRECKGYAPQTERSSE